MLFLVTPITHTDLGRKCMWITLSESTTLITHSSCNKIHSYYRPLETNHTPLCLQI